jgi:hypothetical protein
MSSPPKTCPVHHPTSNNPTCHQLCYYRTHRLSYPPEEYCPHPGRCISKRHQERPPYLRVHSTRNTRDEEPSYHPYDGEEDIEALRLEFDARTAIRLQREQDSASSHTPSRSPTPTIEMSNSSSLRAGNNPASDAPNFEHVKDVKINHQLDDFKVIWDTLTDSATEYTRQQREQDLKDFIKKRAAEIRIGATIGWSQVPRSKLLTDMETLGVDPTAAGLLLAQGQRSFRSSHNNKSKKSNKSRESKKQN